MHEAMKACLDIKKETDTLLRSEYGQLTARQYLILAAISEHGESASLTEVARDNRLSTQAARAFVNRLGERGYLTVVGSQTGDKRKIVIRLTEAGEGIVSACPESHLDIDHKLVREQLNAVMANADRFFEAWACSSR